MAHNSAMQTSSLLHAPVGSLILRIAMPNMIAMVASGLCAFLDALLLGAGDARLSAAVSVSFSLLTLIQTLGFTLGMGAGSFVSRSLGRGDKPSAYAAASTAFFCALALSVLLCALGLAFLHPLMRLLGAEADLAAPAGAYARYVLLSAPLLCTSLVLSSLLRAQGKAMGNMLAFSLGAAAGIPLQLLLVRRLSLGVNGAGAAMLTREAVTFTVLLLAVLREKHLVRPSLRSCSLRPIVFVNIMRSGVPTLVRQGLMSVSSVLLMRASASFGPSFLSGMGLAVRASSLIAAAAIGFGQGFAPVFGYAFGAGSMARVSKVYASCQRFVVISLLAVGAFVFLFAHPLLARLGQPPEAAAFAASVLRAHSAAFFAQGAVIVMNMLTQAMGLPVRASLIAASRQGYILIPLVLILPRVFGAAGLILCQSASDFISLALSMLLTRGAIRGSSCARGEYSDARTTSR
ncbi:MAG: polysaccharide biosynthesis C-terminal domain-containing protein [Clostridia bacterium]|nr:polysaccharide biosynthesis C-terminal domain-containing protein [Clostridia bacterium]